MIVINGHIKCAPEHVEGAYAALQAGIERTLAEEGCIAYNFAIEDKAKGLILVMERWRDQACLDAHLSTPEIAALVAEWGDKMTPDVVKMDASNPRGVMD